MRRFLVPKWRINFSLSRGPGFGVHDWNFRHLVNVQRSAGFQRSHLLHGWPSVRIVNPLELIYGNQDQDI